jgi:hypothetical protein
MAQKKNNKGSGCLGMILIMGGVWWWMSYSATNAPPAAKDGQAAALKEEQAAAPKAPARVDDNLVAAVREAQHIVGQRLKNPADAKWPGLFSGVDLRTHAHKNSDGSYTIKSYVDATTPLGVRKRVWYLARATGSGNNWTISEVAVND